MNTNAMVAGSLAHMATQTKKSLAETFISCDVLVIVDVSGSMAERDSRDDQARYDVALQELGSLQRKLPGKIGVIAFSNTTEFVPGGIPPFLSGGTDMTGALKFARVADVPGMRFILISDGCPDNEETALGVARTYKNRIDTVHVGPESNRDAQKFLKRLSKATGGAHVESPRVLELESNLTRLLQSGT